MATLELDIDAGCCRKPGAARPPARTAVLDGDRLDDLRVCGRDLRRPCCRCRARPTWTCWSGAHRFRRSTGSAPTALAATNSPALIYGARISLVVGLCAPIIGLTIGGALGMLAGYFRGRFESVVVGSMDVLLAFPPLDPGAGRDRLSRAVDSQSDLHSRRARRSRLHAGGAGGNADAGAPRIRDRGTGAWGDACAHPAARIAAQRDAAAACVLPARRRRHHRGRRLAVVPRPRRAAADIELGQHDRGGAREPRGGAAACLPSGDRDVPDRAVL